MILCKRLNLIIFISLTFKLPNISKFIFRSIKIFLVDGVGFVLHFLVAVVGRAEGPAVFLILHASQPQRTVHNHDVVVLLASRAGIVGRVEVDASVAGRLSQVIEASNDLIGSQVELAELLENVFNRSFVAKIRQHEDTARSAEVARRCPVRTAGSIGLRSHGVVTAEGTENRFDLLARDQHDLNAVLLQHLVVF